jgi:serine/threonine-protein kinase
MVTSPTRRTTTLPPPPPPVYYDLEEPIHRRPVWPWIAAFLFVIAAAVGGYFLYTEVSNKLNSTKPVAVGLYLKEPELVARQKIKSDGFVPVVNHHSSRTTASGLVYKQNPIAGKRFSKGTEVTIWVSTGLPKSVVPNVVGKQSTDAVAALTQLHLKPDVHEVPSSRPAGEVTAQSPPAGEKLTQGQPVRINVSKGPQPVAVPNVLNLPIDQASSTLQAAGFQVSTRFVDNDQPANTVIDQSPQSGASAGKGSVVSLTVSKGPKTSTVPDVSSTDLGTAEQTLRASGFSNIKVVYQDTSDPNSDGVVLDQSPQGGQQVAPKTAITLTVGRLTTGGDTTTGSTTTAPTP